MTRRREYSIRLRAGAAAVVVGMMVAGCGSSGEGAGPAITPATVAECLDATDLRVDRSESTDLDRPQADLIAYYPYPSKKHRVVLSFFRSEKMARLVQDPEFDRDYGFVSRISETPTATVSYSNDLPVEAVASLEDCVDLPDESEASAPEDEPNANEREAGSDLTAADLLAGSEMAWSGLNSSMRAAVADEFLARFGQGFPKVTSPMLLAQANDSESSGIFATIDTGQTLQRALKFMAQVATSNEIFKAKTKYLPGKEVIGMTSAEVEEKLGRPDRDQDISGVGVIWYYDLQDNIFQLIFSNGVVTTVNKY